MANQSVILEPQITLQAIDGNDVFLNASPQWAKKLADFLDYATSTDDAEVDCHVSLDALKGIKATILKKSHASKPLHLSKLDFLNMSSAIAVFSDYPSGGFYDYSATDYNRLHDDMIGIYDQIFDKKSVLPRRIKTGLSGDFDG